MKIEFFVPDAIQNQDNARHGHWAGKARYQKDWRRRTAEKAWITRRLIPAWGSVRSDAPKRVTLLAHVWHLFDDTDGLRSALKPVIDGIGRETPIYKKIQGRQTLVGHAPGALLIHTDAPGSGHEFHFAQRIDRKNRGVLVTVETIE